ncbi:hypothetical protein [Halorubrum trueperi]|uniref:Uncharacterized protein n=1 Tax=Halorubrum trueperi TaxID=2004704 RepID=A0ABD5UMD4_9EURY
MGTEAALHRHGDLMQGFGISRLQFDIYEPEQTSPFLETRSNTLLEETPLEAMYVISNSMQQRGSNTLREQLDACLGTIRDDFFEQENYAERDDRPTVKFWNISWAAWGGNDASAAVKEFIEREWDDFEAFGGYLRQELTVDGTEPFLIGGFGGLGRTYSNVKEGEWVETNVSLARAFDAVSNWTGDNPANETVSQGAHIAFQEENFAGYEALADDLDIEFIPVVQPGFDDRQNKCWGSNRYIPRSPGHLEAMFDVADNYGTTDRVDVASFNDWGEGHQIEPGSYRNEDYETEYLEVVKSFVTEDS